LLSSSLVSFMKRASAFSHPTSRADFPSNKVLVERRKSRGNELSCQWKFMVRWNHVKTNESEDPCEDPRVFSQLYLGIIPSLERKRPSNEVGVRPNFSLNGIALLNVSVD
jgi:hypothetical protein